MLTTVMGWNYRRWVIEELAKAQTNQENVPPFPSSLSSDLDDKTRAIHLELARHELKYTHGTTDRSSCPASGMARN